MSLFSQMMEEGYLTVPKILIKTFGVVEAIILTELYFKQGRVDDKWVEVPIRYFAELIGYSEGRTRALFKLLKQRDVIRQKVEIKGRFPNYFYTINTARLEEIIAKRGPNKMLGLAVQNVRTLNNKGKVSNKSKDLLKDKNMALFNSPKKEKKKNRADIVRQLEDPRIIVEIFSWIKTLKFPISNKQLESNINALLAFKNKKGAEKTLDRIREASRKGYQTFIFNIGKEEVDTKQHLDEVYKRFWKKGEDK